MVNVSYIQVHASKINAQLLTIEMQRPRVCDLAVAVDTQGKGIKPKFVQQRPFRGEPYTWATENIAIQ